MNKWRPVFVVILLFVLNVFLLNVNAYAIDFDQIQLKNNKQLSFKRCHVDGIKTQVLCGELKVPENYQYHLQNNIQYFPQITIKFVVIPAIERNEKYAPLMFLAGGPGQSAVGIAAGILGAFNEVRKTRDLLLIDQRGTGQSQALVCSAFSKKNLREKDAVAFSSQKPSQKKDNVYSNIPEDFSSAEIEQCLSQLTEDLSQYNSENAIRDFNEVRQVLGYQYINIYGSSYGTRAGLLYMQLFPQTIQHIVLDGVAPIEKPIGLFGQSSAASFELLLTDCEQEEYCQQAFPQLKDEFQRLVKRLEKQPMTIEILHPKLGIPTTFVLTKAKLYSIIIKQLYSVPMRSFIPLALHQAYIDNYLPLAGLIAAGEDTGEMSTALYFNIICNEDFARLTADAFNHDAQNNFSESYSHKSLQQVCPLWPTYPLPSTFTQALNLDPLTIKIPSLILSGGLDPVTPASNGEALVKRLPNSHHIIVDNLSHGVATSASDCVVPIINQFLMDITMQDIDTSCLNNIPKASFMTTLNGGHYD